MSDTVMLAKSALGSGAARPPAQEIIRVEHVKKHYGDVEVLKGVDLAVDAGQFTAIMGKSGSGKSTLLGIIAGLEKPDEGDVFIMGHKLAGMSDRDMATLRRRSIGIVFQGFSLIPSLTALDNVLLPTFFATETSAAERRQRGVDLLQAGGLGRTAALSPGDALRRRAAARGNRARANEQPCRSYWPTSRPAISIRRPAPSVLELLLDLGRTHGTGLLMVTHDPDVAAKAGNVVEMKDGRISDGHA